MRHPVTGTSRIGRAPPAQRLVSRQPVLPPSPLGQPSGDSFVHAAYIAYKNPLSWVRKRDKNGMTVKTPTRDKSTDFKEPAEEPIQQPADEKSGETPAAKSPPSEEKSEDSPKGAPAGKGKKSKKKTANQDPEKAKKKPKGPPNLRVDYEFRNQLLTANAEMPGATYLQTAKAVFRAWLEKSAYSPTMHCSRPDPETLHQLMGMIAEREKSIKQTIRGIIRAKIDPEKMAELTLKLEEELEQCVEARRTIMRIACIPVTPDLPDAVGIGITALQQAKLDDPRNAAQYDANIEILKSYRPVEYELPEHLRHMLRELRRPLSRPSK